jgi:regulator of protease activity HflC (stomatin/prohibitin superfamily)
MDDGMSVDRPTRVPPPVAATADVEVDRLCRAAAASAPALDAMGRTDRAGLLTAIGQALEADRIGIVSQADRETSLGTARLHSELTRTRLQLEHFAAVLTDDLAAVLARLDGQLSVSVHCTQADERLLTHLHATLRAAAGRIVFNGYPTGVAVTWAQQHGGPYPATTSTLRTSVGATSIRRWPRPVVYQDAPMAVLPAELAESEVSIPRRVDGNLLLPHRQSSAH